MKPQTRMLVIANNRHAKSNFELLERLEKQIKTDLPITIILDPNAEEELMIKKITLYEDTENKEIS